MESMLTKVSISLLLHGAINLLPLVQVSSLNQVNSLKSSSIRFQISISDGLHRHELLLPTIYSSLVETGQLKEGSIIKVTKCTCNIVHSVMCVYFPCCLSHLNQFHAVHASKVFLSHWNLTYFFSQDYRIACTWSCHSGCNNYSRSYTLPLTCIFSLPELFLCSSES